ncbi:MAG: AMP phosphorylase [Candidatus Diapherotrites archaeon]
MHYAKELKTRIYDFESQRYIAVLHEDDARELGLHPLQRVKIYNPKVGKSVTAIVDISRHEVKDGEIGLFEELRKALNVKKRTMVQVSATPSPESFEAVRKKMKGQTLSREEIDALVKDIDENNLSEIELAAFMTSVYIHGFNLDETISMTKALLENGKTLGLKKYPILDKHSIGGTNGRATLIIVPIIASLGYYIPKNSSRAITSAAGTADAMEVLCPVSKSISEYRKIVEKTHGAIVWGGALDLAPVDDKIIKIENPLHLDPEGQIVASVMAKKASVGAQYLVIDLPIGPDVKIANPEMAQRMAEKFVEVGKSMGIKVEVEYMDGENPSGNAFGPALEARHALEILEGRVWNNLAEKSCTLAGKLLELCNAVPRGKGFALAKKQIESGKALQKLYEIIQAQGGKPMSSGEISIGKFSEKIAAKKSGTIQRIHIRKLNDIAREAGAPNDKGAGILLHAENGQNVQKGKLLFEIFAENKDKLFAAKKLALENHCIEF